MWRGGFIKLFIGFGNNGIRDCGGGGKGVRKIL